MSKARDSYRVRQVGHQLLEIEVRTIWLFETTPGVSRSKFPVLQHRSGRQEAALQSESQPQKRPLLISFFSSVLWEKNHSKGLTHLCLLLSASQATVGAVLSQGRGPLPWGGWSRTSTLTAGFASSWLCWKWTVSHSCSLTLLMDQSTNVLVCTPRIHGPCCQTVQGTPTMCIPASVSLPTLNCRHQPRERQPRLGWLLVGCQEVQRGGCHPQSAWQMSYFQPFRATGL